MNIIDYLLENYNKKNDLLINTLIPIVDSIQENQYIDENIKKEVYKALFIAKGYTEYKCKEISSILDISKTALKYKINKLIYEHKLEIVKYNNVTFLKPIL